MTQPINAFAAVSVIPKRVLRYLQREGVISDPLSSDNQLCLRFLEQVWGRAEMVRPQLAKLSMKARLSCIRTADLSSKWERYAYSRFRNQEQRRKLAIKTVVEEIEITFGFRLSKQQKKRLHTIRNRAQVARFREKNRPADEQENLLHRANQ